MTPMEALLCGAAVVLGTWALYFLFRTGTCASGGPYISARPCPTGTGGRIAALVGAVFLALIGTGVYATRGGAGGGAGRLGLLVWSLFFLAGGGAALLTAYGPAARPGSELGSTIVAAVFIPMGLLPLIGLLAAFLPDPRKASATTA